MSTPTSGRTFSLGGDFAPSVSLNVGESIAGYVRNLEEVQSTKMGTNEPDFWDPAKTQPKLVMRLTLQTDQRTEPTDDGQRSVILGGSRKSETQSKLAAVLDAVRGATGGTDLAYDAYVAIQCIGQRPSTAVQGGMAKTYSAQYRPPAMSLGNGAQPMQQAQPQPQVWQQQPVQQPPPPQPQATHTMQQQDPWAAPPLPPQQSVQQPAQNSSAPAGGVTPEMQAALDKLSREERARIFGGSFDKPPF